MLHGKKPALPRERGEIDRIPDVQRREERLCDMIAAELLMPEAVFFKYTKTSLPSFDALTSFAEIFDVSISSALLQVRESRAWSLGVRDYELGACQGTLRRRSGWISVSRSIRGNRERWKISREIDHTLEGVEHFLQKDPQYVTRNLKIRFRDFNMHFLLADAGRKIKAIALKQS